MMPSHAPAVITVLAALLLNGGAQRPPHSEEAGNRDEWQRPAAVMDALHIQVGSQVADIGAGEGYFTFHLAHRVGHGGRVYAVDIVPSALEAIRRRAAEQGLNQVTTVLGAETDPRLPAGGLDVVLVVNTYHELTAYDAMMQGFWRGLKPGGLLAIIDSRPLPGERPDRYARNHHIPEHLVRDEATRNGFRFLRSELGFVNPNEGFNSYWYFLVFVRPS